MSIKSEKRCGECSRTITGRIDKRFCSDQCRSCYHNRINGDVTNYIRNTNHALKKNRRILAELNPAGKAKVSRDKLLAKGFDFQFCTSTYTTKDGSQYTYCYEQGYLALEKGYYLLVVKKEYQDATVWPLSRE
jgi:hypothetical protein